MKMWFVYILRCKDKSFYTGFTPDLERRFREHKGGRGGRYTRLSKIDKLVYYEMFSKKEDALKREKQIKGWRREKKENLIKFGDPNPSACSG